MSKDRPIDASSGDPNDLETSRPPVESDVSRVTVSGALLLVNVTIETEVVTRMLDVSASTWTPPYAKVSE